MKSAYGRVISTILQLRAPQFTVAKTINPDVHQLMTKQCSKQWNI